MGSNYQQRASIASTSPQLPTTLTTSGHAELSDEQKFQIFSELEEALRKSKEAADAEYAPGTPAHNVYLTEYATLAINDALKKHGLSTETFDLEKFGKEASEKGWYKRLKAAQADADIAFSGSGTKSTKTFVTRSRSWELAWKCEQSVSISVFRERDDSLVEIVGSQSEDGSSIVRCQPGSYYLKIIGIGEWSVTIHQ